MEAHASHTNNLLQNGRWHITLLCDNWTSDSRLTKAVFQSQSMFIGSLRSAQPCGLETVLTQTHRYPRACPFTWATHAGERWPTPQIRHGDKHLCGKTHSRSVSANLTPALWTTANEANMLKYSNSTREREREVKARPCSLSLGRWQPQQGEYCVTDLCETKEMRGQKRLPRPHC